MEKNRKENEHKVNEVDATEGDELNEVDGTKAEGDDDCNKWWQSTKQTLLSFSEVEVLEGTRAFSISIVPDELRKWNENAYEPKVVSMGPTCNRAGTPLLLIEGVKRACSAILLIRSEQALSDGTVIPKQGSHEEFSKMIWRHDELVRSCYTEEISLDRTKLATTMLCDCCFLLLLPISGSYESKKGLITHAEYSLLTPVRKMEETLTDLMLLENQIPLPLVINLSKKLFPEQFRHDTLNTFKDMALSLLSCSSPPHGDSDNSNILLSYHFLSLVHSSIFLERDDDDDNEEVKPKPEENGQCLCLPMADNNEEEQVDGGLNRCAMRLRAAGVTLKPPDGQGQNTKKPSPTISSFNFDIRFRKGTLEIPQLHITEATEPLWRNFIAWEHHRKKWFSNYWRNAPVELLPETGRDTFSSANALGRHYFSMA